MTITRLTTSLVADLSRQDKTKLYSLFTMLECKAFMPEPAGIGESRQFTPEQAALTMLLSDLTRWGLTATFAARLVGRIAETLAFAPDTEKLSIQFHANGASYHSGTADGGRVTVEAPDHAPVAGAERFRLTIALSEYRRTVSEAVASYRAPRVLGDAD